MIARNGGCARPSQAQLNRLALWLAACQPTYPFYVKWLAGGDWWLGFGVAVSVVPFALVPRLAKAWPLAGRLAIPLIGSLNTALALLLFGRESGVGWLIVPAALVMALSGVALEGWLALGLLLLGAALPWAMPGPIGHFSAEGEAALLRLNLGSALALCPIILWMLAPLGGREPFAPGMKA